MTIASETLSGTYANGVTLVALDTTITTAGVIGNGSGAAVYGAPGTLWTVANYGMVTASGGGGVDLDTGGLVVNATAATIYGDSGVILAAAGTVANAGSIAATGGSGFEVTAGVYLNAGGVVTNAAGGSITGYNGIYATGGPNSTASVLNAGMINGSVGGIDLGQGGAVTNAAAATIIGQSFGIVAKSATISNTGRIIGTDGSFSYGIVLESGGAITNAAGGLITGHAGLYSDAGISTAATTVINSGTIIGAAYDGIVLSAVGTVVNAGTIRGGGGTAVALNGQSGNLLVVNPGALFGGSVVASGSANTLQLASGASVGTISGIGGNFYGFNTIAVVAGSNWQVAGSVTGSGTINLGASAKVVFNGSVAAGMSVAFAGGNGTLGVATAASFLPTVADTAPGDVFYFTNIANVFSATVTANTLQLLQRQVTLASVALDPSQNFTGASFHVASDGGRGTFVTESIACFRAGTRIAVPAGEVAVETLQPGDLIVTASGRTAPIQWVGRRHLDCTRHPSASRAWPVRIYAGAFGPNLPRRDLLLSPQHAIYAQAVLIPAFCLINGLNVVQELAVEIDYVHIELERHDILLAEGLPTESYLENGDRAMFENAGAVVTLHPDYRDWTWDSLAYAELKVVGPEVDAVRALLLSGGSLPLEEQPRSYSRNG